MLSAATATIAMLMSGFQSCGQDVQWGLTPENTASLRRFEYSQIHMGTRVNVVLYAPSPSVAERAASAAFRRFAELEQIMSDYRPDSELMRLCDRAGEGPVRVSRDLFAVLSHAQELAANTDGAFDITAGPIVRLWRQARNSHTLPGPEAIAQAKANVGWRLLALDPRARTASVVEKGVRLDLGGIAKGYACSQAIAALKKQGVTRAMVEAGGDLAVSGPPPGYSGWQIRIRGWDGPTISLSHRAVSTSGDAEQFVEIRGVRYSHIVDPRTGLGLTNRIQTTVIARDGLVADPLATALCVLGPERGAPIARRYGARAIFVLGH